LSISKIKGPLTLILSGILLFLSICIIVPAATDEMLPLSVGTPEVSSWLILLAFLSFIVSFPELRQNDLYQVSAVTNIATVALALIPFVRLPDTIRRAEEEMHAGFGTGSKAIRATRGTTFDRSSPLHFGDLLRGIPLDSVRITTGIEFARPGKVPLSLNVYRPLGGAAGPDTDHDTSSVAHSDASSSTHPIVVQIYGGAWQRGAPANNEKFSRWLAARGYTVFAIDYRHAPDWRWPAQLEDVLTALTWIRDNARKYEGDTSHVFLLGRSAGAQLAQLAAFLPGPLRIQGVVNLYGPVDLLESYRNPPTPDPLDVREVEESFIGGSPNDDLRAYRDASPITYAGRKQPPSLLIYGARDNIVELRYGQRLRDKLRQSGSSVALITIPWADHSFDAVFNGPSSQLSLYYIERFLAKALAAPR
jgi:acetyl esterase/lipase